MVTIEGRNYIAEPPEKVFDAGSRTVTWPRDIEGLDIDPGKKVKIKLGSTVSVAIDLIAGIPASFEAEVVKFEPAEHIIIEGSSALAEVALHLSLLEDEIEGGTNITHMISIGRKRRFIPLPAPDAAIKALIEPKASEFAEQHCVNVGEYIENHKVPALPVKKRAAA